MTTGKVLVTSKPPKLPNISFGLDGTLVALWDDDGKRLILWDTLANKERAALTKDEDLRRVEFAPNGKTMATVVLSEIRLWDTVTGKERLLIPHSWSLAFTPRGDTLAEASKKGVVTLWDTASGRRGRSMEAGDELYSMQFSPTARFLATCHDGRVRVWELASGQQVAAFVGPEGEVDVTFSPDSKMVVARFRNCVMLYDLVTGKGRTLLQGGEYFTAGFTQSGQGVIASTYTILTRDGRVSKHGYVTVLDLATLTERATVWRRKDTPLRSSPDGSVIARGERNGSIKLWFVNKLLEQKSEK